MEKTWNKISCNWLFSSASLNTARRFTIQAKISIVVFTVHRHFKWIAGYPENYIAVILFEELDFCLQLTMRCKYTVFQSQHYDSKVWIHSGNFCIYQHMRHETRNLNICRIFEGGHVGWRENQPCPMKFRWSWVCFLPFIKTNLFGMRH